MIETQTVKNTQIISKQVHQSDNFAIKLCIIFLDFVAYFQHDLKLILIQEEVTIVQKRQKQK